MNPLFVDVQAVGSPAAGFPLEIAWKVPGGCVHRFFFRGSGDIPPRVREMTGITRLDLSGHRSLPAEEIAKLFTAAVTGRTPVAHHSPYEKRWLEHITGLELHFACTRELAAAKLTLPSGSLRAVAGLAGFTMGPMRRAGEHVLATEAIYSALSRGFRSDTVSRECRLAIPEVPGVYLFLDCRGSVLYVGKAKNLRRRVNGHFTGRSGRRKAEMLCRVSRVDCRETSSALHAAVLESSLISSLSPEYNRAGKIRDETLWYLSRDFIALSGRREQGSFGPFTSKAPLEWFSTLLSSGGAVFPEVPEELFARVFDEWIGIVRAKGALTLGRELHRREKPETGEEEIMDAEYVLRRLNGSLESAALQIRRSAAMNLLHGGKVSWGKGLSYSDDYLGEGLDQAKLRTLSVLLTELKRVHKEGKAPELLTRWGSVLRGAPLGAMLEQV